jgi:hypothetical protein
MIENVFYSKNNNSVSEFDGTRDDIEISTNKKAVTDENSKAYEISFSEEGWKALGDKKEKEKNTSSKEEFSEEEQRKIDELKKIDRKVHVHEQAHLSAAGGYARGGTNYNYVTGPDGKRYANAGHVNLDTGKEKTPEATIRKATIIQKAALAPADPSPSDRQIATDAMKMISDAQRELSTKQVKEKTDVANDNQKQTSTC